MNEPTKKLRSHSPERIILTADALVLVNKWMDQVRPLLKGNSFTRSELVNCLITNRSPELSAAETQILTKKFFDPVKALAWASREIAARKKAGEPIDVAAFMVDILKVKAASTSTKVKKRVTVQAKKQSSEHIE